MVISETIICQRFIQNAWKKDLCSNCFKSKEDHVVIPEKKIAYRWTSHVNNFPQHGILKNRQKNGDEKQRNVSFQNEETEIIGFGGEEYSDDDDDYPVHRENGATTETDNEEENKEFRQLTKSNTDFNSNSANLRGDKGADGVAKGEPPKSYSHLKFGMPIVDADGRRQTLQVTVEPFRNSVIVTNGARNDDRKSHSNKTPVDDCTRNRKTEEEEAEEEGGGNAQITNRSAGEEETATAVARTACTEAKNEHRVANGVVAGDRCDYGAGLVEETHVDVINHDITAIRDRSINCDSSTGLVPHDSIKILSVTVGDVAENETNDVFVKDILDVTEDIKYTRISNIILDETPDKKADEEILNFDLQAEAELTRIPEPTTTNTSASSCDNPSSIDDRLKLSYHQFYSVETDSVDKEKRSCSMNKDCNPITLPPLMVCKALDIEFDNPCSRELVGEPDGKADSDDSCDPVPSAAPLPAAGQSPNAAISIYAVNSQRSFLHDSSSDGKSAKQSTKPVAVAATSGSPAAVVVAANETPKKTMACKEPSETTSTINGPTCTPKMPIHITCNGTGSVKRQAPKPPTPKITAPSTLFTAPTHLDQNHTPSANAENSAFEQLPLKCESPLVSGQRDAISFLSGDQNTTRIRRKLNLGTVVQPSRNSLNVCISISPNGIDSSKRGSTLTRAEDQAYVNARDSDTSSICSVDRRIPPKCSRSLSCDSVVSSSIVAALPEKTRKYSVATLKVKSKIRKLLRFNNKDDEKQENDVALPKTPIKRIEIIHPLDLNKSSIEILGSNTPNNVNGDSEGKKKTDGENRDTNQVSPISSVIYATCATGRPTKPPPPPRAQSLDQKYSEISRPVRPPPPKCGNLKPSPSPLPNNGKLSTNLYENLGQSRNGMAPAKPQRVSSIRERSRQIASLAYVEETFASQISDKEAVPECDQNFQSISDSSESTGVSSMTYSGSETESDIYDSSNALKNSADRKGKSIMHRSLEDNYEAVINANHDALIQLAERVNQATLVPASLQVLQTTLHLRFEHLTIDENSRLIVGDWHFFNASWNNQKVVVSLSEKHFGSMRSLPTNITLYPLVKFNDMIPSRILKNSASDEMKTNACITIWNEEYIETIDSCCSNKTNSDNDCGLLVIQMINVLLHLQSCGINDVSSEELFICKRDAAIEPKLLLLPFTVDSASNNSKIKGYNKMPLYNFICTMTDKLLPKHSVSQIIQHISYERPNHSLDQMIDVAEYWMWGPGCTAITNDRLTSLRRWLDLERATFLHKMICKAPSELSIHEIYHMIFLVRTNAKTLTKASLIFEKYS